MADEANVIRSINWNEVFPFTLIFRSFRVAIHPSKLVLALVALVGVYVGGCLLDGVWPEKYRASYDDMRDFETAAETVNPHGVFEMLKTEREAAYARRINQELGLIGKSNGTVNDLRESYIRDRDVEVKQADEEYAKNQTATGRITHELAVKQAYDRAQSRWSDVSHESVGPFHVFFIYELGQLNHIVQAVRMGNLIGVDGVTSAVVGFFAIGPVWAIREHTVYFTLFGLFFLTIWSVFGGAITRIAAVHIARDEKISIRQALAFSTSKFLSFVSAPVIPLLIVLGVGAVVAVGGVLLNIPVIGPIVVGLLFILAIAAGFVMTLVLLGLIGGFNLMYPTIAVEGSDSFDAISRSFSYLYARPWRLGFYTAVAIAYGALTYLFVRYFLVILLSAVHFCTGLFVFSRSNSFTPLWQTMWPSPGSIGRLAYDINWMALSPGQRIGAFLVACWVYLTIAMLGAFAISFYFSANTVIYYLMRREVDATEVDDVYLEQTDEEFAETPAGDAPAGSAEGSSAPAGQGAPA